MYFELMETLPTPERVAHPEKKVTMDRQPTVAEWLPAAAAFAKDPVFHKKGGSLFASFGRLLNHPPRNWKPTPWFPVPWNKDQMETFDRLPSLGFVHRPVFVRFEDEHGKPVTRRDQRQKMLEAGWQQALQTLPDAERATGPARIIGAYGENTEQMLALEGMLYRYAEQGGPEIDSSKTAQFINTDRRLGNTGAATFFVQMALGVMGSYINGGASAAVNLRDPAGASIVFISPPSEEKRKAQQGGNVFKHKVAPAIDPANYEMPSVEALIDTYGVSAEFGAAAPVKK
jgi:hypothetical protein